MKIKYGFQIRRKDNSMRMEESGFFNRDAAENRARAELTASDSHAQLLSYHWRAGKFVQARHIKRIEAN